MKKIAIGALALILAIGSGAASAQGRAYKEGPVTDISYIRTKDGHFEEYMRFLDGPYKALMEAQKKAGLITDYRVLSAEPKGPGEADLLLLVTYPNMAALDRVEEAIALAEKVSGPMEKQEQAAVNRGPIREVLGSQLVRELVLK